MSANCEIRCFGKAQLLHDVDFRNKAKSDTRLRSTENMVFYTREVYF